jgi:hypothetical protein
LRAWSMGPAPGLVMIASPFLLLSLRRVCGEMSEVGVVRPKPKDRTRIERP